jgi:hypothetical protein
MTDIKWVPEWVKAYTIETALNGRGLYIEFYMDAGPGNSRPIEELRRDVVQQIKEKPLADRIAGPFPGREKPRNKYDREILPDLWVDVYDVLGAFTGTISSMIKPAIDHAIKKLLAPGLRGVKEERQDLVEARDSIDRAIQKLDEWV